MYAKFGQNMEEVHQPINAIQKHAFESINDKEFNVESYICYKIPW